MSTEQSEGHAKPDEKTLRDAGELEILDESGKAITFNQLYNTENRQVIVFIRHFFCGVSSPNSTRSCVRPTLTIVNSTAKTTYVSSPSTSRPKTSSASTQQAPSLSSDAVNQLPSLATSSVPARLSLSTAILLENCTLNLA